MSGQRTCTLKNLVGLFTQHEQWHIVFHWVLFRVLSSNPSHIWCTETKHVWARKVHLAVGKKKSTRVESTLGSVHVHTRATLTWFDWALHRGKKDAHMRWRGKPAHGSNYCLFLVCSLAQQIRAQGEHVCLGTWQVERKQILLAHKELLSLTLFHIERLSHFRLIRQIASICSRVTGRMEKCIKLKTKTLPSMHSSCLLNAKLHLKRDAATPFYKHSVKQISNIGDECVYSTWV